MAMPRWLPQVLRRIQELAEARRVLFTLKARRELATLGLGLDQEDACDLLARLESGDFTARLVSSKTGEWLYVFKPTLAGAVLDVKVILRDECVVISFHEDEGAEHEEEDDD